MSPTKNHWNIRRIAHLIPLIFVIFIIGGFLSASTGYADSPPESDKEPPPTPATLPTETVQAHLTEDGKLIVIIFLKEQPLQVASREVRDEFEPRMEALSAQFSAMLSNPLEGQPLTEEQELLAVATAPNLSAAQQDELDFLNTQMDALNTEMRLETMARAMPYLEDSQAEISQVIEEISGQVLYQFNILNGVAAAIPPEARADIEAHPDVAEVVNDQRMSGHLNISVPTIYAGDWWSAGYDGGAYDVAVVDSGIDDTHPALSSQSFCEKRCLTTADLFTPGLPGNDPSVDDVNGHGTHVAGIVASTNGTYTGVAFGLDRVFNCKAGFDSDGVDGGGASMYWSDAMSCVDWALVSNTTCGDFADGVNLSYGGSTSADDTSFARFWDAVVDDLGIPVSISAGNSGPGANTLGDPSIAYNVMCVANMDDKNTSTRSDDTIRTSSSRGPTANGRKKPDITAPGTNILSTDNTWEGVASDWVSYSGTSMAAPHVAGAQLLMTDYLTKRPMVQKAVLLNTADDWGAADWDSTYGWGYLNLSHAVLHRDDWFRTTVSPAPDYDFYKGSMFSGDTATLVWNRRVSYSGAGVPSTYYALSDLDLRLYNENTNSQIDSSASLVDNVEQVQASGTYNVVIKVDPFSISFAGKSTETYALATEENFTAANGPAFSLGTSNYNKCVGEQWTVNVTGNNIGDLDAHGVQISLTIPAGVSITSGSNPQSVGSISDSSSKVATWTMQADAVGNHNVSVAIESSSYGENFSGASSLSVDVSDVPTTPALISPGNGIWSGDTTPFFDWSSVSGASSYQIQVDDDPGFSSPEINTFTGSSAYTPPSDLPYGTYYWRVRADNSCGPSLWSPNWQLNIFLYRFLPIVVK